MIRRFEGLAPADHFSLDLFRKKTVLFGRPDSAGSLLFLPIIRLLQGNPCSCCTDSRFLQIFSQRDI